MKANVLILAVTVAFAINGLAQSTGSQISKQELAASIQQVAEIKKFTYKNSEVTAYAKLDQMKLPIKSFAEQGYIDLTVDKLCKLLGHEEGLSSSVARHSSVGISSPAPLVNVLAGSESFPIRMGRIFHRTLIATNYGYREQDQDCKPGSENCAKKLVVGEQKLEAFSCKN